MKKISKRFKSIEDSVAEHALDKAVEVLKTQNSVKFDESVDMSFNLNLLKKHVVRDTITFPHGFSKSKKVIVFAKGDKADEAKAAGADEVGGLELIEKISGGWLDFEVAIAAPDMMRDVAKIARILGTRGLMPSPKAKTVTSNIAEAVKAVKAGRKEYRANEHGILNFSVGKKSMDSKALIENALELFVNVLKKKPSDLKGDYIKSMHISSTMGKSVRLNRRSLAKAESVS